MLGKTPREKLEESLEDCFEKIISMHNGVDNVLGLIPESSSSVLVSISVDWFFPGRSILTFCRRSKTT